MNKGDRVLVKIPYYNNDCSILKYEEIIGTIIGEGRDKKGWLVLKDGTKWVRRVHKRFCSPL